MSAPMPATLYLPLTKTQNCIPHTQSLKLNGTCPYPLFNKLRNPQNLSPLLLFSVKERVLTDQLVPIPCIQPPSLEMYFSFIYLYIITKISYAHVNSSNLMKFVPTNHDSRGTTQVLRGKIFKLSLHLCLQRIKKESLTLL